MEFVDVSNVRIPALGFGTWQITGAACRSAVAAALEIGYRHIDTAQMYENEAEVGLALSQSGIQREKLWVTTKLARLKPEKVLSSTRESLRRLNTDYLDLLLIHWPDPEIPLSETLGAMQELVKRGEVRHIGVSNFTPKLVAEALAQAPVSCNQVECHPFLNQAALRQIAVQSHTALVAYAPLARGKVGRDQTLLDIGRAHDKSPHQVALRWLLDKKNVVAIPKAQLREHAEANFGIFDLQLTAEETRRIDGLNRSERLIDPSWAPNWGERPRVEA